MAVRLPGPCAFVMLLLCGSALAADGTGRLDGRYGDEEGCILARTGSTAGDGFFFLMDDEGISTAVSYCAFSAERKTGAGGIEIEAQCREEGEEEVVPFPLILSQQADGYLVTFPDGMSWGPLMRCLP